jgi:predicted nucleic acid-binding protein
VAGAGMVIDTSIFIEYLRSKDRGQTILANLPVDSVLYVSSVTVFELYSGATDIRKRQDVDALLQGVFILPLNAETAKNAGFIYQDLRRRGSMIEVTDIMIAATALANDLPVKTLNIGHFQRVSDLVTDITHP